MEKGLLEKTGKSLAEWITLVQKQKLEEYGEIMKYLKTDCGVTHGFANFVALKTKEAKTGPTSDTDLVSTQYAKKQDLLPIYERLIKEIAKFGKDVEIAPKKTSVSLRRAKQFALIKPATKTRIDLGLKLKGKAVTKRLEDSGPFGTMCTHRVQITDLDQVDKQLVGWLKEAYAEAN